MPEEIKQEQPQEQEQKELKEEKDTAIELPTLDLENYEIPDAEAEEIKDESKGSMKFAFIGSGQCGSRLAESFYKLGYKKVLALNTTPHDLKFIDLPENQKFFEDIGPRGAGKDMERGKSAVLQYQQEIFDKIAGIFGAVDHIFISFGCGGGSGSGSFLPLLEIAKRYLKYTGIKDPSNKVGVICTLPTDGEANSPLVKSNTENIISHLTALTNKNDLAPAVIIDNNKIKKQYRGLTVKEFWPKINNTIAGLFHIFNLLSNQDSPYTSFDPVDYRSIIQSTGFMILGLTGVKKYGEKQDISNAVKQNLKKTLLAEEFDLETAKIAGSIAVGGKKIMSEAAGLMDNISYGFDCLSNLCKDATLHRGVFEDDRETLRIYTIIGGLKNLNRRF